jgi:hypothetical protein
VRVVCSYTHWVFGASRRRRAGCLFVYPLGFLLRPIGICQFEVQAWALCCRSYPVGCDRLERGGSPSISPMGKFSPRRPVSPSEIHIPRAHKPSAYEDNRVPIPQIPNGSATQIPNRSSTPVRYITRSVPHGFDVLRETPPDHLKIRRLDRLAEYKLERQWQRIRSSHYASDRIPIGLDMDCLYYRFPSERSYCQRLSILKPPPNGYVTLSTELLCLPTPWVSGQWRESLPVGLQVKHPYQEADGYTTSNKPSGCVSSYLSNSHRHRK